MPTVKTEILQELDALIERGRMLDQSYRPTGNGGYFSIAPEVDHRAFLTSSLAVIARVAGRKSEYFESVVKPDHKSDISGAYLIVPPVIPSALGALVALRETVDRGLLRSVESRLRANVHDDFLAQARDLLDSNYHVAAMVLVGGVLEDHLRKLCEHHGQVWAGHGSLSKYNDLLRDVAYPRPTWRRVQSIADVRNDAAHGIGGAVKSEDVEDAFSFTSRLITDHPA